MAGPETTSDKPKPDAATSAAVATDATSYVGSPAVGTSKAAPAAGVAAIGPDDSKVNERRRRLVWCAVGASWVPGLSPSSGFPSAYAL